MRVVITGANSGIGKEAAVQLASEGCEVIMACRNAERAEAARDEVLKRSGRGRVAVMLCDTSSRASIRSFVREYTAKYDSLDVLINNAAHFDVTQKKIELSEDGIESVWATNYLGPFLLSGLLVPLLEKSTAGGRILNVSSKGLLFYPFLKVDLNDPGLTAHKFSMARSYYHSKLALVISTIALAARLSSRNISVNTIRVTNVRLDLSRYPDISAWQRRLYAVKSKKSIEPAEMAEVYTYLATSPEVKGWTGVHVDEKKRIVRDRRYVLDRSVQEELFDYTMKTLGLSAL